jgi:Flp pilus assembly protein TadD
MEPTQERIAGYRAKVVTNPDNELLRFSLGKALFDAGQQAEAEEQLKLALAKKPDWMVVVMLLAQCALKRNDRTTARSCYERALELAVAQHHEGPEAEIRAALKNL